MLIKAVLIFLLAMAAIGMIGNALFPGALGRSAKKRLTSKRPTSCKHCGRYVIGKSGCECGKS
jgi:hypothetical protein